MLHAYVVHWKAPEWLASCVSSVLNSDIAVEVTVINNSGPLDVPGATVIDAGGNLGYASGANVGLREWLRSHPLEPYVVVASHDLHVEPDTMRLLVEAMESDPRVGIAGPAIGSGRGAAIDEAEHRWLSGTCLILRRTCIEQVGLFDERFGSYVEDVDLGLRARDAGWSVRKILEARASGVGSVSPSLAVRMKWANQVALARKREGALAGWRLLALQPYFAASHLKAAVADRHSFRYQTWCARERLAAMPLAVRQLRRFRAPRRA